MYQVLHSGFDTLDIAYMGAFPEETLARLEAARDKAEAANRDVPLSIGPGAVDVHIKSHGQRGGYRYILTNGPTGAIFSIKKNARTTEWNLFVSVRAMRLLTHGYDATKQWIEDTLAAMGFTMTGHSVNRLDYAIDILAPDFELDVKNFITPSRSKARPYWSDEQKISFKEQRLTDDGNRPQSVISGRQFESVTIGKMPNRQVIVYDKRRAAIDQQQPYWFEAWDIDPKDPGNRVWRVEIRAGRDALAKKLPIRRFNYVEAMFKGYLESATDNIRYVIDRDEHRNVSRAELHPLWNVVNGVVARMTPQTEPPLPEARVLAIMRDQRADMAVKQGFGNLINKLVLDGLSPEAITKYFPDHAARMADAYAEDLGDLAIHQKVRDVGERLKFLIDGGVESNRCVIRLPA
jgi:hypothetical protein